MRTNLIFILLISFVSAAKATTNQESLYLKTFGQATAEPVIFLHGGPGYSSRSFEVSTAQALADQGFFVVVYDRRGEGQSIRPKAKYTFKESIADLKKILEEYKLGKVNLIGHSFGGMLGTLFAEKYPEKVKTITLVGAPLNLQESFSTIIASSKKIYTQKNDKINLGYIKILSEMDSKSLEYSTYCFFHAMQNGFYSTKTPNQKARELYLKLKQDTSVRKVQNNLASVAPKAFWKNEKYTTMDLSENLTKLAQNNYISVFGIYGKEDGLYSPDQVSNLEKIIGIENVTYLDSCSHSVFIDRQDVFIDHFKNRIK